jgi:hypothetical protein
MSRNSAKMNIDIKLRPIQDGGKKNCNISTDENNENIETNIGDDVSAVSKT